MAPGSQGWRPMTPPRVRCARQEGDSPKNVVRRPTLNREKLTACALVAKNLWRRTRPCRPSPRRRGAAAAQARRPARRWSPGALCWAAA
ncbi:unnamed protein product [Prorocentrum cordatum]|uniref:Uncharacterized protein n=1 Tax=Prorocentrum cordatum TaxID=2364126 RepID=A0ABN9UQ71_9DINO|nr:unnamed protein product [Polarella glacialis]